MGKKLIFIKLGGSVISDKTKVNQPRLDKIDRLAEQLKELEKNFSLIIFTGAGGFGHPVARKYKDNLEKGLKEIKNACKKINKVVVSSLNKVGLKAKTVEPDKVARYENGKMTLFSDDSILKLIKQNIIPVFHADLVDDKKLGISILSMDKFLVDLAIYLKKNNDFGQAGMTIEKAIFVGSTPVTTLGVGDRPVGIVRRITKKSFFEKKNIFYQGREVDVSGGMKYKVEQCLRLADIGINCYITDYLFKKGTLIS